MIDVTHPIAAGMPRIKVLPEVRIEPVTQISAGQPLNIAELHLATHAGTHVDAPAHAIDGGATIDQIPLDTFCGPGAVIGVQRGAGEEIPLDDVTGAAVEVRDGDILLLDTGWAQKFHEAAYDDHPYPSVELARWCVSHQIKMLGVDCITVDAPVARRPQGFDYPVHRTLLGNNVLIIENLASLAGVSNQRVEVWAFPLKVSHGDAGHVRVVLQPMEDRAQ
jgi:arylformamidase